MEDALSFSEKGKEKNNTFPFPLLILILQILIWLFPLVVFDQIIIVGFYLYKYLCMVLHTSSK